LTDGFRKTQQSKKSVTIDPNAKKAQDLQSIGEDNSSQLTPNTNKKSSLKVDTNKEGLTQDGDDRSVSAVGSVKFDEQKLK
jgi:hypothetical protein